MGEPVHGELLLACPDCRKAVTLVYHPAHLHQGLTNLDDHRVCHHCGSEMVETGRDEEGRVVCPEPAPKKKGAKS